MLLCSLEMANYAILMSVCTGNTFLYSNVRNIRDKKRGVKKTKDFWIFNPGKRLLLFFFCL